MFNNWVQAIRPRTLPLAIGVIFWAECLAFHTPNFSLLIGGLTFLTALLLQILSNIANDYGDTVKGADNHLRTGPERMVHSGKISSNQMKKAMYLLAFASFVSGSILLFCAYYLGKIDMQSMFVFFGIGLLSILAAIIYTNTKFAYGYIGLGDVSVFLFFGLLAVGGSCFLQSGEITNTSFYAGIAAGLFCTGVLNLNNMRDIDADKLANKHTVAMFFGFNGAKIYHGILVLGGLVFILLSQMNLTGLRWFVFLPILLMSYHLLKVFKSDANVKLAPLLPELAMFSFITLVYEGLITVFLSK